MSIYNRYFNTVLSLRLKKNFRLILNIDGSGSDLILNTGAKTLSTGLITWITHWENSEEKNVTFPYLHLCRTWTVTRLWFLGVYTNKLSATISTYTYIYLYLV